MNQLRHGCLRRSLSARYPSFFIDTELLERQVAILVRRCDALVLSSLVATATSVRSCRWFVDYCWCPRLPQGQQRGWRRGLDSLRLRLWFRVECNVVRSTGVAEARLDIQIGPVLAFARKCFRDQCQSQCRTETRLPLTFNIAGRHIHRTRRITQPKRESPPGGAWCKVDKVEQKGVEILLAAPIRRSLQQRL